MGLHPSPSVVLRDAPHRPWCCDAEIDTPSHSDILTHIYPEYMTVCNCDGEDCPKNQTFLSMPDPTNAATWQFLSTVLGEVASLFPDEAFHIGGDEWWPAWATAPTVQKFMQAMNYSDAVDVYHYYERGIIDIVRGLGKTTVCAWEDIDGEPRSAAPLPSGCDCTHRCSLPLVPLLCRIFAEPPRRLEQFLHRLPGRHLGRVGRLGRQSPLVGRRRRVLHQPECVGHSHWAVVHRLARPVRCRLRCTQHSPV